MSSENKVQIYRGEHEKIKALNDVGMDLSELCDRVQGLPGEGTKYVFPVRAQITYFRIMHPHGLIETEIIRQDDFQAQVKATVYGEDGKRISMSHGVSTANGDGDRGFQMLPTAESRAIGRALDFAGFGCQLRIQSYDGDDYPTAAAPQMPEESSSKDHAPAVQEDLPRPTATPDPINTRLKVPANEEKRVMDVSELEQAQEVTEKSQRRKKKTDEPPAPPEAIKAASAAAPSLEPLEESTPYVPTGEACKAAPAEEPAPEVSAESPPATELSAYEAVQSLLGETCNDTMQTQYDPDYFGENFPGDIDPNAFYVNANGYQTRVTNGVLQKVIKFYLSTPGALYLQIKAPVVSTSVNYGKTLGDLLGEGDAGKAIVCLCAGGYKKDNPATLAGVLVCAKLHCKA